MVSQSEAHASEEGAKWVESLSRAVR